MPDARPLADDNTASTSDATPTGGAVDADELSTAAAAAAASAAVAAFFERVCSPGATDIANRMRAFVKEFSLRHDSGQLPVSRRATAVQRFVTGMSRRAAQHPAWKGATANELAAMPDALEKYATTKLYS